MLASLLARYHRPGEHEADRYAAWMLALEKLRTDWSAGARPACGELHAYLNDVIEPQRVEALQDLIAEHLRLSWQEGSGERLECYSPGGWPAELVEDELLARYQLPHGDTPSLEEYRERFSARPDVIGLLRRRFLDGGRFVMLRKLGLGAMGEVWQVYDHQLRRLVAIKTPRTDLPNPAKILRHFAEEARVTAGLEHPGIVSVHEYRHADGTAPFYVMRLICGQSLSERIRQCHQPANERSSREQRLLWNQLFESFVSVCDAIAYAHRRGVLHRDLKPGNIVVGESGDTVILDWGVAQRFDVATPTLPSNQGASAGTPEYMAPEQATGMADVRTDIFGLGAILYELLTSRSPHGWSDGGRPADWRKFVQDPHIDRPRNVRPGTPRALDAICMKALAADPTARYQCATEIASDLRCYLAGEPISALKEPFAVRLWRRIPAVR